MNSQERITRARIQLYSKSPFFTYIVMRLQPTEKDVETIGVNLRNELVYNPKYVETLNEAQLQSALVHETLHLAWEHLTRCGKRDQHLFNVAGDICINNILVQNGFEMFQTEIMPKENQLEIPDLKLTIKNIDGKNAEVIYDELYQKVPKTKVKMLNCSFNESLEFGEGTPQEQKQAKKWKEIVVEAATIAKQQGKVPVGMERLIGNLLNEKVSWKHMLYKYITNELPFDSSYSKPHRRSQSVGFYMPHIRKENINIMAAVDTSGSISQQDLTDFMTELISIAKSFHNLKMNVIICDCEIKEVLEVANGNIDKLLNLKIKGGGGTSHIPVYDKIINDYPQTKFLISFTDGFTDFPETELIRTVWIVPKNGNKNIPFGEVVEL